MSSFYQPKLSATVGTQNKLAPNAPPTNFLTNQATLRNPLNNRLSNKSNKQTKSFDFTGGSIKNQKRKAVIYQFRQESNTSSLRMG